jgi:hypothetical protein
MPVPSRSPEEISERSIYFSTLLELQIKAAIKQGHEIQFHVGMPNLLSHVYFVLTDAYKTIFLAESHRTDKAKRAAITCAAIAYVNPLRPVPGKNVVESDEDSYEGSYLRYANPMLAMRAASSIVDHPFNLRPFDDKRRKYRALSGIKFPSLEPIVEEHRLHTGEVISSWEISLLSEEETIISMLVDDFVMYSYLKEKDSWDARS